MVGSLRFGGRGGRLVLHSDDKATEEKAGTQTAAFSLGDSDSVCVDFVILQREEEKLKA